MSFTPQSLTFVSSVAFGSQLRSLSFKKISNYPTLTKTNRINMIARSVQKVVIAREQSEGQGARVRRTIGGVMSTFDPFVLLDEFHVRKPAGFPEYVFSPTISNLLSSSV